MAIAVGPACMSIGGGGGRGRRSGELSPLLRIDMEYACARLGGFIGSTGGCSPLFIIVECIVLVPSILGYIIGMVGPMVEPMEAMPPPTGVYVLITFVSAGCLNPAKSPPILARPVEIVEFVIIFYHIPHQGIVQAWSWRKSRPEEGGRIQKEGGGESVEEFGYRPTLGPSNTTEVGTGC